jgi:hypothetical protein
MEIEDREISDESDEEPDEAPSPPPGFGALPPTSEPDQPPPVPPGLGDSDEEPPSLDDSLEALSRPGDSKEEDEIGWAESGRWRGGLVGFLVRLIGNLPVLYLHQAWRRRR